MKEISLKEIIKYKILPFNLYNERGQVVVYAEELLTPGKILEIKDLKILLFDEKYKQKSTLKEENPLVKRRIEELKQMRIKRAKKLLSKKEPEPEPVIEEYFEMYPETEIISSGQFDKIDISKYKGTINKNSIIPLDLQLKLKYFYSELIMEFKTGKYQDMLNKFLELRDRIFKDIVEKSEQVKFLSELKLIGEYQKCHALNIGILSGTVGKRLECNEKGIKDLILCGLLHDIGKIKLNPEIAYKRLLSNNDIKEYSTHTLEGYKIIKEIFELDEQIARPALEHHEFSDGSGYPKGISFDSISFESHVVSICNFYDNLTFNRTPFTITNSRDAVKVLLEMGSKKFSPEVLYTFANKFAFNDITNFSQMIN